MALFGGGKVRDADPHDLLVGDDPTFWGFWAENGGKAVRYGLGRPISASDQLWSRLIRRKHVRDDDLETQAVAQVSVCGPVGHEVNGRCGGGYQVGLEFSGGVGSPS